MKIYKVILLLLILNIQNTHTITKNIIPKIGVLLGLAHSFVAVSDFSRMARLDFELFIGDHFFELSDQERNTLKKAITERKSKYNSFTASINLLTGAVLTYLSYNSITQKI